MPSQKYAFKECLAQGEAKPRTGAVIDCLRKGHCPDKLPFGNGAQFCRQALREDIRVTAIPKK